jgi:hypothetical protein
MKNLKVIITTVVFALAINLSAQQVPKQQCHPKGKKGTCSPGKDTMKHKEGMCHPCGPKKDMKMHDKKGACHPCAPMRDKKGMCNPCAPKKEKGHMCNPCAPKKPNK